ncbi:MAG: hypothetical protein HeimC3_28910 [Candidatus Heimdallarchaeota archaeon LC_3]|nr:MAG: hypothetical protein HeimC3_28910 [Candidatus Heimdallarchaeota archaeon LC_3]
MIVEQFSDLQLENKEIIRLLGKKKNPKSLDTEYVEIIENMKTESTDLIIPKAIYKIFDQKNLESRECFDEAEKIGLAICTIGENLPNKVNKLIDEGDLVKAVILDAIGSVAVEKVADYINEIINRKAKQLKFEFSTRYSPGYCSWEIKDQKLIFDNLPGNEINVHLTDSFMMKPIKSVSFAVNFGQEIKNTQWENRCKECERKAKCSYQMG